MKKTNWRTTLNKDYLAAPDLDDGNGGYIETDLTIANVVMEQVSNPHGEKSMCKVAHFKEHVKPMILNIGHCELIEQFSGSRYLEDWGGTTIRVYVALNQKAFGNEIDACRIRPQQPRGREELTPDHQKWDGAVDSIAEKGDAGLEVVEQFFDLSDANRELLKSQAEERNAAH